MSDKRTVATDALETLGSIIGEEQKRDAIHLAVEPVIAGERLKPGEDIGVVNGIATTEAPFLGIVDPFLKTPVRKGEMFWFIMYPRQVNSLRHVWTHPAFPDSDVPVLDRSESEKWLREYIARTEGFSDWSYEDVLTVAGGGEVGEASDDYYRLSHQGGYISSGGRDAYGSIDPEFWRHAEIVLGRKLEHAEHFSCSC